MEKIAAVTKAGLMPHPTVLPAGTAPEGERVRYAIILASYASPPLPSEDALTAPLQPGADSAWIGTPERPQFVIFVGGSHEARAAVLDQLRHDGVQESRGAMPAADVDSAADARKVPGE